MIIPYCLNIHPGETLAAVSNAITEYALRVKTRIAPDNHYPLGLRLSAIAVEELSAPDALDLFKASLEYNSLYATGINGFPYGTFHGTAVKSAVYQPDWSTKARVNYSMKLCSVLSALLPDKMNGNISTVPLGYKTELNTDSERLFVENISVMADFLSQLHQETGKRVTLAIEPEPDCVIDNSDELIAWFERFYDANNAAREYIGVCLDTCHFAVEFEDPLEVMQKLEAARIRIERIQLSSAISTTISEDSITALTPFIDQVYLHQTKIQLAGGEIISLPDLTEENLQVALQYTGCNLRTHFHVPLFFEGTAILQSTHTDLSSEFFTHAVKKNYPLEIETYTFDVLPPSIKPKNIIDSLVMEHEWVTERL